MTTTNVTTTATQIRVPDTAGSDTRLYLQNRGSVEIFLGPASTVTAASGPNAGIGLVPGVIFEYPEGKRGGGYDVWVITAIGSAEVRWVMI